MAAELRISVDQSLEDSRTKINEFLSWVRQQRADLTVGAAVGEAQRAADMVALYIGRINASIDVGANTALAVAEARMAAGRINGMSANIDVGADVSGAMGSMDVTGTVDGNRIGWKQSMTVPMPMKLTCEATIEGDTLTGKVNAGAFGDMPLSGERA